MSHSECPLGTRLCTPLLLDDQPVRALLLIHVQALAIIASDTLARDDLRASNRSPLALLLADLARITFRPTLDPKNGQVGKQSQKRPDWAQEPAIEVPDEHRRKKQHA